MRTFLRAMRRIDRARKLLTVLQWLAILRLVLTVVQSFSSYKKG